MTESVARAGSERAARIPGRISALLPIAAGLVIFLLVWEAIVILGGYPPFILPPPDSVLARLVSAWGDGTIAPHAARTLLEIGLGFGAGAGLALIVGYVLARSALVERVVSPYLVAAQATPILALAPVLALWFGPGLTS